MLALQILAALAIVLIASPALAHGGHRNVGHVTVHSRDHHGYPHRGGGPYPFNECGGFVGPVFVRTPCL